jgi:hypothetical protein
MCAYPPRSGLDQADPGRDRDGGPVRSHTARPGWTGALWTLVITTLICTATSVAASTVRVDEAQGTLELATGPKPLLTLVGQGKVTARALIAWGRVPQPIIAALVRQHDQEVDLLSAGADEVAARAEALTLAGDAEDAGHLTALADLLRSFSFLDWAPLGTDAALEPGAVLRAGPGVGAVLRWADGSQLTLREDSVVVLPEQGPEPAPATIAATVAQGRSDTPECAAALAAIDAVVESAPGQTLLRHLGPLSLQVPADWLPIPEVDRNSLGGFAVGGAGAGEMWSVALMAAPGPEADMIAEMAKEQGISVEGPTLVNLAGKAANRYRMSGNIEGKSMAMSFYFFQTPPGSGPQLVLLAGGGGTTVDADMQAKVEAILASARLGEQAYALLRRLGGPGEGPGQLKYVEGLGADGAGNVYVLDGHHDRVQVFDADGQLRGSWGKEGFAPGQFFGLADLAVDPAGQICVLDRYGVERYTPDGKFLGPWGADQASDRRQSSDYSTISLDAEGRLYGLGKDALTRVAADGAVLGSWPAIKGKVAFDPKGNMYWVDRDGSRIHKNDGQGKPLWTWTVLGRIATEPPEKVVDGFTPESLATDDDGNLYVGDNDGVVRKYDPAGRFLLQWGPRLLSDEPEVGQPRRNKMGKIADLAVDHAGRVYVSDRYADTVLVFEPSAVQRPKCAPGLAGR